MIRRKFMKFAPKEHNDEKVKANLQKHNVPVFEGKDPVKFGQYGSVAKDLGAKARRQKHTNAPEGGQMASAENTFQWQQKALYGGGTGAGPSVPDSRNPYAIAQPQGNPYASSGGNPYGAPAGGNPYGAPSATPSSASPGPSASSNSYGSRGGGSTSSGPSNPYGSEPGSYRRGSSSTLNPSASSNTYKPGTSQSGSAASNTGGYSADYSSTYGESSVDKGDDFDEDEYLFGSSSKPSNAGAPAGYSSGYGSSRNDYPTRAPSTSASASASATTSAPPAAAPGAGNPPTAGATTGIYSNYRRNQSTEDTTDIRNELFGSAPQRLNPDADEFDELNRTTTELQRDEDLELSASNLDRPVYATGNTGAGGLEAPIEDEEDELNALPSEFAANNDAYAGNNNPGYTSGQQLFEDSEDEDVEYVKREIRQTKQESVESTRRALEVAREAELSGTNALGMLGNQGERLGGTAKTVALGNVQARTGDRNADELIRLNRSIFIPNISNPFNSRRRNQLKEQRLRSERAMDELESQELEMKQREADRRIAEGLTAAGPSYSETVLRQRVRMNRDNPERKMYQFEADSDDDALEDELGGNLDEISSATNRLHNLSLKIQEEVDDQNVRIDHMGNRVDALDMSLLKSTAKMSSIN